MFGNLRDRIQITSFFKLNNKKLSTYTFFLFLSFSFWFLSMLSKHHETTLRVPVVYVNFPADKVVVSSPISFVEVRVKAPGFSILFYNLFNLSNLTLNLEQANIKPTTGGSEVFWLMNSKRKAVAEVISSSMELLEIEPERLIIPFNNKAKKVVAVKLNKSISLKPEIWFANPISLVPDSVIIYGDQHLLDLIDFVETKEFLLMDVSESIISDVQLIIPSSVECKTSVVEVIIEVEPFIEQLLRYKVEVENLKKGYVIKLFPETVQVTIRAPKNKYSMLQTDFLKLKVDASLITEDSKTLTVEVESLPSFIQLQRMYPSRVEFLLIKE